MAWFELIIFPEILIRIRVLSAKNKKSTVYPITTASVHTSSETTMLATGSPVIGLTGTWELITETMNLLIKENCIRITFRNRLDILFNYKTCDLNAPCFAGTKLTTIVISGIYHAALSNTVVSTSKCILNSILRLETVEL